MARRLGPAALSLAAAGLLGGCAADFTPSALQSDHTAIGNIQGTVRGGQSPISGAEIFLFAAGSTGYGSAATSLISSTGTGVTQDSSGTALNGDYYVTTDANGNFSLSGDYTCTAGQQVYLVAYSGNPGNGGGNGNGNDNTTIMQMAGLGQCPASGNMAQQVPYLVVNEISTVAFAYAMSGYGSSATSIGAPSTTEGQVGIANAMNNVFNILNIAYGQSPTVANSNPNGVVPQSKIYTLANILGACVNTKGPGNGNGNKNACNYLFSYTGNTTDEASAIFYIAHNPTTNVLNLYGLQPTTPVFSPNLSSAPTDWTIPVVYNNAVSAFSIANNTTISGPFNIAFDANGNAWIGDRVKGVVKMTPQGAVTTYNSGFGMIKGVTVSPSGNIWAADYQSNKVYIMNTSGTVTTTITSGLSGPDAIAFDASGNAYVTNEAAQSVSVYNSSGTLLNGPTYFSSVSTPGFIAVDTAGNAWIPSTSSGEVGELTGQNTANQYGAGAGSYAVVLDASNTPWLGDYSGSQLDQLVSHTIFGFTYYTTTSHSGGGLSGPYHMAFDGSGYIWIANLGASVVSGWNPTGSAWLTASGFTTGTTGQNVAAVPDISGNLWVANTDGSITQILGLATPTYAPLLPGKVSTKP